jgi:hypothetical protein
MKLLNAKLWFDPYHEHFGTTMGRNPKWRRKMLEDEFRKAKSSAIIFRGHRVLLFDTIELPEKGKLRLRFKAVHSEWRQGVRIGSMTSRTNLRLTVAGRQAPGVQLWQDTCPSTVDIDYECPSGALTVYNIWDTGDAQSTSQTAGAGMRVDVSSDGKTRAYYCNDGHPDQLFESVVFEIEILHDEQSLDSTFGS